MTFFAASNKLIFRQQITDAVKKTMDPIQVTCANCGNMDPIRVCHSAYYLDIFSKNRNDFTIWHHIKWPDGWVHGITPDVDFVDLCNECDGILLEPLYEMWFRGPLTSETFHAKFSYDDIADYDFS
jgi:hypothetical protein